MQAPETSESASELTSKSSVFADVAVEAQPASE